MIESWIVVVVLVAIIAFQEFCRFRQALDYELERRQLLDRLMARSFQELVEAQVAGDEAKKSIKVVTVDDLKKEIMPPSEEGIPI